MDAPPFPVAAIDAGRAATKAHLRIEGAADDEAIDAALTTALAIGEAFTGTAWIARQWRAMLPRAPGWQRLPATPVTAITLVEAVDAAGTATLLPVTAYAIDIDARGDGWVRLAGGVVPPGRVRVTFVAGTASDWAGVPAPLTSGAVALAAHCFEARVDGAAPPAAVAALWRPWRRLRLAPAERCA
ncbi:head-tail connector protein [Sphingomonas sp. RS6]